MQSLVVGLCKSARRVVIPCCDKSVRVTFKVMKLKLKVPTTELAPEGVHAGTVKNINSKGESKCTIEFGVVVEGRNYTVGRDYAANLQESTSPLYRDAEVILGRKFAPHESDGEFDMDFLKGQPCSVYVRHQRASGGRMVAAVTAVLPGAEQLKAA